MRQLREIRLRRGLSQADLSGKTGVAEFTISEIEAGKRANPRPSTLRKLAEALEVEVAAFYGEPSYPKEERRPSPEPSLFNGLEEGRRLRPWITYVSRRVEQREKVVERTLADEWNNPWLSLDSAIPWAVDVGMESTALRDVITREVLPHAEAPSDEAQELRALLDRFRTVEDRTDERVNTMMDEARMDKEEKRARFELIHGERSA